VCRLGRHRLVPMRHGGRAHAIAYDAMQDLIELFRHNTWANAKVFDLAASVDSQLVTEVAPGTRDTVLGTLGHLAAVEYAYLGMLEGHPPQSRQEVQTWAAHDLSWFPEQMRDLGDRFVRLLESSTPQTLAAPLNVPWFTFRLTAREGLRQVLTHSAQHRSQVLSWLSARGTDTPDLDYVLMLREERTPRE
jgi:uncharacterized damage-inducible protein DinB